MTTEDYFLSSVELGYYIIRLTHIPYPEACSNPNTLVRRIMLPSFLGHQTFIWNPQCSRYSRERQLLLGPTSLLMALV